MWACGVETKVGRRLYSISWGDGHRYEVVIRAARFTGRVQAIETVPWDI